MANIQDDINQIATARYGREVRGSIVDALTLMNEESSEAIDKAVTAQDSASASAESAEQSASRVIATEQNLNKLKGGNANQVLTKNSNADFDYSWKDSQGGGGGASDAYEVTYGDTNVGDTLDVMPRLAGEVQTVAPAPKDADTLGGRITAEDIDAINTDLSDIRKKDLGSSVALTNGVEFLCPSDGYFLTEIKTTGSGSGKLASMYVNDVIVQRVIVHAYEWELSSVFVKKGMRIKMTFNSGLIASQVSARYIPFV